MLFHNHLIRLACSVAVAIRAMRSRWRAFLYCQREREEKKNSFFSWMLRECATAGWFHATKKANGAHTRYRRVKHSERENINSIECSPIWMTMMKTSVQFFKVFLCLPHSASSENWSEIFFSSSGFFFGFCARSSITTPSNQLTRRVYERSCWDDDDKFRNIVQNFITEWINRIKFSKWENHRSSEQHRAMRRHTTSIN